MFACIWAPMFMVQAVMREARFEQRTPVAVLDGPESTMRVIACNAAAEKAGVQPGMTRTQAEQHSSVILQKRSREQEQIAQAALIECGFSVSPRVESTAEGAVTIDLNGTEKLFGSPRKITTALRKRAREIHFDVNVAVAANPDAALVAAKGIAGVTIIPEGAEKKFLSPLPLAVLSPSAEQLEISDSWGIRTCGELAKLPSVPLTERLGQEGLRLQRLAAGKVTRTLVPFEPSQNFEQSVKLEDAVETLEPLMFVINGLLADVMGKLRESYLSVQELHLTLGLEVNRDRDISQSPEKPPHGIFDRVLKLPVPMQDARTLLKLLQLDLENNSPGAPVIAVTLKAIPAKPRVAQGNLFVRSAPEAEKLEVLQAKLRSVVGQQDEQGRNTVGAPAVVNSHQPDSFEVAPLETSPGKKKPKSTAQQEENLLRIYRPPRKARVRLKNGRPAHLFFAGISSTVRRVSGPWRCSGKWWQDHWQHDIWDVEVPFALGEAQYRIFRDLQTQCWFVRGKFN
jgi:protein ImuB